MRIMTGCETNGLSDRQFVGLFKHVKYLVEKRNVLGLYQGAKQGKSGRRKS